MFSLEFIARKTKVVTNEISRERRTVSEESRKLNDRNKVHKSFRRRFEVDFLMFSFAYFMTLNSAFKYRNLWQLVILCRLVISDNYG